MNHNTTTIHTEGGSAYSGPIDTHGGDFVARDKIIHNYPRLDPADSRNQRNHAVLRQTVRRFWVDGVLKSSLYNEMLIRLGLDMQPEAVDNRPWDLILQQPGQPDETIDDDKEIATIFAEMNQLLLILGEPGAGKTTTLLTLADALLHRADADPTLPTAVVFNLSSWAEKEPPLDEWLVDELRTRYRMPKKVSQSWVENDELVLLLDGLDEVAADKRAACVKAINDFRQEHIVGMVICSRIAEYSALNEQLKLEGAVAVRPLTMTQVDEYVTQAGPPLAGLGQTLAQSQELRELAQTPLMLSVMALAYHDQNMQGESTNEERNERQYLFDRYIQHMFEHRELSGLYLADQTLRWLRWLAGQMIERSQTLFLIEELQPDRLERKIWVNLYRLTVGLISGLSSGLIVWLVTGLIEGLIGGLCIGLFNGLSAINITAHENLNFSLKNMLIGGLINGLIGGLSFGLINGLSDGLNVGLAIGLISGLIFGLIGGLIFGLYDIKSWQEFSRSWVDGLASGLIVGLIVGLILGLGGGLIGGLINGLGTGLGFGLSVGLSVGIAGDKRSTEAKFKEQSNQGIWQSLQNGLIAALGIELMLGLIFGELYGFYGLLLGLFFGLKSCLQHLVLRFLLYYKGQIPWNYTHFLDYVAARFFLRKVGGGYVFVHRMLMEHFASLSDEDIARIVQG